MKMEICNVVWPIYLAYFLYQNYKWLMASGHQFGTKDGVNAASSEVIFTGLLIVISFSLCQLGIPLAAGGVMIVHLLLEIIHPKLIDRLIKAY
ncbi:MAG: hypothetical protein IPH94_14310 [Saprospiraceae bacterium]|nr:hypothetical protein [Saprospiraceae bacterium]MBK7787988.1 hypothetical protein [Saprospiraceae bacterium]MBK8851848.1 hypothetical protein [Saprospiraceae bacterium]MBL0082539.1 hypothetical protein [Saprospiraceae bacterium]